MSNKALFALIQLLRLSRTISKNLSHKLKDEDVSTQQLEVMLLVLSSTDENRFTQKEIADLLNMKKSSIHPVIEKLKNLSLIKKVETSEGKLELELTKGGQNKVEILIQKLSKMKSLKNQGTQIEKMNKLLNEILMENQP